MTITLRLAADTPQEAFDMTVEHLLTMPRRAVLDGTSACRYLTEEREKCAIGNMILAPLGFDHALIEGQGVYMLMHPSIHAAAELRTSLDLDFLVRLQGLHDEHRNWDSEGFTNIAALRHFAEDYGLSQDAINRRVITTVTIDRSK